MQVTSLFLGGLFLCLVGCGPGVINMGGWTWSRSDPEMKANFAGTLHALDANGNGVVATEVDNILTFDPEDTFRGQFQYNDRGPDGVRFHGVVTGGYVAEPGANGGGLYDPPQFPWAPHNWVFQSTAYLEGTYRPIPSNLGPGGTFEVTIFAEEAPFDGAMDKIWVYCEGGVFDGYSNTEDFEFGKPVEGGVLTFHPYK